MFGQFLLFKICVEIFQLPTIRGTSKENTYSKKCVNPKILYPLSGYR